MNKIISWKMYFQSDQKFHEFLIESKKIAKMEKRDEIINNIYKYCPIWRGKYYLRDEDGRLRIWLYTIKHDLLGKESWLPFLAHFVEGEFRVKGERSSEKWGAKLDGKGNYKKLKAVQEWI